MEGLIQHCEHCGQGFQPSRVYTLTAPNRPRFCSAACRGKGYRMRTIMAIEDELMRAQRAIERARAVLQRPGEQKT